MDDPVPRRDFAVAFQRDDTSKCLLGGHAEGVEGSGAE